MNIDIDLSYHLFIIIQTELCLSQLIFSILPTNYVE
jgi:hypothetical protein